MNNSGWFNAAIKMATDMQRAEYDAQRAKFKRPLKQFIPDWRAVKLAHAAHEGDEHETKRLMHVIRMGCDTLI